MICKDAGSSFSTTVRASEKWYCVKQHVLPLLATILSHADMWGGSVFMKWFG